MMDTRRRLMMSPTGNYFGVDTDFSAKEADWVEEGGTFDFRNNTSTDGLYQASGSTKIGSIVVGSDYRKHLTIPISVKNFIGKFVTSIYSGTTNNYLGNINLVFQDENQNDVLQIRHTDDWNANKDNAIRLYVPNADKNEQRFNVVRNTYSSNANYELSFSYSDGVFSYSLKYPTSTNATSTVNNEFEIDLPEINFVRITFGSYSTYETPRMIVAKLVITPV